MGYISLTPIDKARSVKKFITKNINNLFSNAGNSGPEVLWLGFAGLGIWAVFSILLGDVAPNPAQEQELPRNTFGPYK